MSEKPIPYQLAAIVRPIPYRLPWHVAPAVFDREGQQAVETAPLSRKENSPRS